MSPSLQNLSESSIRNGKQSLWSIGKYEVACCSRLCVQMYIRKLQGMSGVSTALRSAIFCTIRYQLQQDLHLLWISLKSGFYIVFPISVLALILKILHIEAVFGEGKKAMEIKNNTCGVISPQCRRGCRVISFRWTGDLQDAGNRASIFKLYGKRQNAERRPEESSTKR